jgi:hypothetical protein
LISFNLIQTAIAPQRLARRSLLRSRSIDKERNLMALKLVKTSNRAPIPVEKNKSREEYMLACLRDELRDPKFSDWEKNFIASLAKQIDLGRRLTDRQKEILERIWEK